MNGCKCDLWNFWVEACANIYYDNTKREWMFFGVTAYYCINCGSELTAPDMIGEE